MKTLISTFIVVSLLAGLAIFTNPSVNIHHQQIYLTFQTQLSAKQQALQKTLIVDKQWATFLELNLIKFILNKDFIKLFIQAKLLKTTYQDYRFFSILILENGQKNKVLVSIGIFGQVFVNSRWFKKDNEIAFIKFLTRLTLPSIIVMAILFVMSIATWYLIIIKTLHFSFLHWQIQRSAKRFWRTASLDILKNKTDPLSHLAWHGMQASLHHQTQMSTHSTTICSHSEFITRALRYALAKHKMHLESGLTFLAMVASTAPFIGLLGTVLGIYSALMAISVQKNVTIETIAAPVGEALIMTAIGLAVAIPAVLAYNFFVRWQRHFSLQLERFAHKLHTYLNTGVSLSNSDESL